MSTPKPSPTRFVGLDVHKYYLVATAVDQDLNKVYGPKRVELTELQGWMEKTLTPEDAVVLEMTGNTWQLHDDLLPHVHSVTVVHPPHVALIVRAQVMTDKIAALQLARLHAKGLLTGIWVPPQDIRDLRTLVAQREKMTAIKTQAKNRLQATLHRYHILPPEGKLYDARNYSWWLALPSQQAGSGAYPIRSGYPGFFRATNRQGRTVYGCLGRPRRTHCAALPTPGVGLVTAVTVLAAIGDITRFPDPDHLVGYSGLGARVHDSGLTSRTGGITKAGRKDLRAVLVEAAQIACPARLSLEVRAGTVWRRTSGATRRSLPLAEKCW